jgi:predicted secreted protein
MAVQKTLGVILKKVSSPIFTLMALTSIGKIGVESSEIDVTTLDSTGGFKEYIAGFKDAGSLPIKGILKDDALFAAMYALAEAQTVENWEIDAPNGSIWTFSAFVKSFYESEQTVEGVRMFEGELRISGKSNYDPTSGLSV